MGTFEEHAASERRGHYVRAAIVTAALLIAGALPAARWGLMGTSGLLAGYGCLWAVAWLTAPQRLPFLRRAGMLLLVEAVLAGAALYLCGPVSPALALPFALTAHYAFLYGSRGGFAAGCASMIVVTIAVCLTVGAGVEALAVAATLLAVAGIFPAYAARQREAAYEHLASSRIGRLDEARAQRVLSALLPVATASDGSHVARALASALPVVTGYPAGAVFLRARGSEELVLAAAHMPDGQAILSGAPPEPIDGDSQAGFAVRQGTATVLGSADGATALPSWARERGFASGIVAPITAGLDTLGAIYVAREDAAPPSLADLERLETFLGLTARFFMATRRHSAGKPETDRLAQVLEEAGRAAEPPHREPTAFAGVELDPLTERASVAGVVVSLSRTEFALLYSLAGASGEVVPPDTLIRAGWAGAPQPGPNAVDVAVHRLRRKLAKAPAGQGLIRTVRGKGYALTPPQEKAVAAADRQAGAPVAEGR